MENSESSAQIVPSEIETKRLNILVEQKEEELGGFNIYPVGESGYVVSRDRVKPMAGNDWVLFDYDDTLAAYTGVKEKRQTLYTDHLHELGIKISDEDAAKVMNLTDKFSRWETNPDEGSHYHPNVNMSALTWATDKLQQNKDGDLTQTVEDIAADPERIKAGQSRPEDPFYISKGKLILRNKIPWTGKIEEIFQQTLINPPLFSETIEAAKDVGGPEGSIHRFNVGIFTYGDPYFQMLKVMNLLSSNPDLPISQIWLTRKPKGEFIQDIVNTQVELKTDLDYVPAELEDYPGESLSFGSGYPLGKEPHVLVMFDDDPKQLSDLERSNEFLQKNTGAEFVVVRSKQPGTKTEKKDWEITSPYGVVDFTSGTYLSKDISRIFLTNRYLAMRKNRGPEDSVIRNERYRLAGLGVDIKALEETISK